MKKYCVSQIFYRIHNIEVEAVDEDEAHEKAMNASFGNWCISSSRYDREYGTQIEEIEEVKE